MLNTTDQSSHLSHPAPYTLGKGALKAKVGGKIPPLFCDRTHTVTGSASGYLIDPCSNPWQTGVKLVARSITNSIVQR